MNLTVFERETILNVVQIMKLSDNQLKLYY